MAVHRKMEKWNRINEREKKEADKYFNINGISLVFWNQHKFFVYNYQKKKDKSLSPN